MQKRRRNMTAISITGMICLTVIIVCYMALKAVEDDDKW